MLRLILEVVALVGIGMAGCSPKGDSDAPGKKPAKPRLFPAAPAGWTVQSEEPPVKAGEKFQFVTARYQPTETAEARDWVDHVDISIGRAKDGRKKKPAALELIIEVGAFWDQMNIGRTNVNGRGAYMAVSDKGQWVEVAAGDDVFVCVVVREKEPQLGRKLPAHEVRAKIVSQFAEAIDYDQLKDWKPGK